MAGGFSLPGWFPAPVGVVPVLLAQLSIGGSLEPQHSTVVVLTKEADLSSSGPLGGGGTRTTASALSSEV